eukprot:2797658-Pyramimonas_sp.AAC.1
MRRTRGIVRLTGRITRSCAFDRDERQSNCPRPPRASTGEALELEITAIPVRGVWSCELVLSVSI